MNPPTYNIFSVTSVSLLAMIVLVVSHIGVAYDNYLVRKRVILAFESSNSVTQLVEENIARGLALDTDWEPDSEIGEVDITVTHHTGVVTIYFPADIDGGGKTLTLIPFRTKEVDNARLDHDGYGNSHVPGEVIKWQCTSSLTRTDHAYVMMNKGTLHSQYAPGICRGSSPRIMFAIHTPSELMGE